AVLLWKPFVCERSNAAPQLKRDSLGCTRRTAKSLVGALRQARGRTNPGRQGRFPRVGSERGTDQGIESRRLDGIGGSPGAAASPVSSMRARSVRVHPNKRLKLTPHVRVFDLSPVRRSLAAIR